MKPHASSEGTTDASARARDLARRVVRDAAGVLRGFPRRPARERSAHPDAPGDAFVCAKSPTSASTRWDHVDAPARDAIALSEPAGVSTREAGSRRDENENENENARNASTSRGAAAAAASLVVSMVALGSTADPALAGFGAPTGAVSSPPLPEEQLAEIISMDRRAAIRKTNLIRTSDFDILLQELNALTQLDEKALEAADAEIALKISENLAENIRDATESLKTAPAPEASPPAGRARPVGMLG